MEKKKASAAHMRATAKYEKNNYDKTLVRMPKGTLDKIRATNESINGFINKAIIKALEENKT